MRSVGDATPVYALFEFGVLVSRIPGVPLHNAPRENAPREEVRSIRLLGEEQQVYMSVCADINMYRCERVSILACVSVNAH